MGDRPAEFELCRPDTLLRAVRASTSQMSHQSFRTDFSRRTFLKTFSYAPVALLLAPLRGLGAFANPPYLFPFADLRITPRYPSRSPLDEMIALVPAGSDAFVTEKFAAEIQEVLDRWAIQLKKNATALDALSEFSDAGIKSSSMTDKNPLRRNESPNSFPTIRLPSLMRPWQSPA